MGLLYLENKDRFCLYNFKTHEVVEELYGGETVNVLIDNKPVTDVISYKNKKWYLEKCQYEGQDLNGLDIWEEGNFLTKLSKKIRKFFN